MPDTIIYTVKESKVRINEKTYLSYGISCTKNGSAVAEVDDISVDREAVEKLAGMCNDLKLDPMQLEDVAEDFVSE